MHRSFAIFNVSMWFWCDEKFGKFGEVWRSEHSLCLFFLFWRRLSKRTRKGAAAGTPALSGKGTSAFAFADSRWSAAPVTDKRGRGAVGPTWQFIFVPGVRRLGSTDSDRSLARVKPLLFFAQLFFLGLIALMWSNVNWTLGQEQLVSFGKNVRLATRSVAARLVHQKRKFELGA